MIPIVELLDTARNSNRYRTALAIQQDLFTEPDATPSARVLAEIRAHNESFVTMTLRRSHAFHHHFLAQSLPKQQSDQWHRMAAESLAQQQMIEQQETVPLDTFIKEYFAQLGHLPL